VVAGLVAAPIVAVPTSVGYGTALGGITPLFAMLTSCANGVSVVNIDGGFIAAMVVHRIISAREAREARSAREGA
jgi:NCAIR mutase (PurE)-related protein